MTTRGGARLGVLNLEGRVFMKPLDCPFRTADRVLASLRAEGVRFQINAHVGVNVPVEDLRRDFHAILLAGGAELPRNLEVPGRELKGIHFAMDYLPQWNRRCEGDTIPEDLAIREAGKQQ